jgi:hypothetical protein
MIAPYLFVLLLEDLRVRFSSILGLRATENKAI